MKKKFSAGFTLIELLIVIAILGILAAGILVAINPLQQLAKARDATRKTAAKQINDAITRYFTVNGSYPDTTCNWCNSEGGPNWIPSLVSSGELKNVPIDPLNTRPPNEFLYSYTSDGSDYCLQIGFETDVSSDPNYKSKWNNSWKLRYGPNGPNGGLCQSR